MGIVVVPAVYEEAFSDRFDKKQYVKPRSMKKVDFFEIPSGWTTDPRVISKTYAVALKSKQEIILLYVGLLNGSIGAIEETHLGSYWASVNYSECNPLDTGRSHYSIEIRDNFNYKNGTRFLFDIIHMGNGIPVSKRELSEEEYNNLRAMAVNYRNK